MIEQVGLLTLTGIHWYSNTSQSNMYMGHSGSVAQLSRKITRRNKLSNDCKH